MYLGISPVPNQNTKLLWYLCPSDDDKFCNANSKESAFIAEVVGTFIMANAFLTIRSLNKNQDNLFNPLFIALATLISLLMIQNVSGASLNPALGIV